MTSLPKQSVQTPRLPKHLPAEVIETLEDHAEYSSISSSGCKLVNQVATHVLFEQVHFRRASFNRTRLTGLRMFDTRAEASDLSGAVWEQARLRRVEFAGCRLLGVQWLEAELEDALFKDCNLEEAVFASATFKGGFETAVEVSSAVSPAPSPRKPNTPIRNRTPSASTPLFLAVMDRTTASLFRFVSDVHLS